jgi:hypothetical protein
MSSNLFLKDQIVEKTINKKIAKKRNNKKKINQTTMMKPKIKFN